jgi:hypothetical protein
MLLCFVRVLLFVVASHPRGFSPVGPLGFFGEDLS